MGFGFVEGVGGAGRFPPFLSFPRKGGRDDLIKFCASFWVRKEKSNSYYNTSNWSLPPLRGKDRKGGKPPP